VDRCKTTIDQYRSIENKKGGKLVKQITKILKSNIQDEQQELEIYDVFDQESEPVLSEINNPNKHNDLEIIRKTIQQNTKSGESGPE